MADILKRLTEIGSFSTLQCKMIRWLQEYNLNTCDENLSQGSEIVELNARIQDQICQILCLCATEGGLYGKVPPVNSKFPPVGHGILCRSLQLGNNLDLLSDVNASHREIVHLRHKYQKTFDQLEIDIKEKNEENEQLKRELEEAQLEMDRQNRASASEKMFAETERQNLETKLEETRAEMDSQNRASVSEKMFAESEIQNLETELTYTEAENVRLNSRMGVIEDFEDQVERLRDEVVILAEERHLLTNHTPPYIPLVPPISPRKIFVDSPSSFCSPSDVSPLSLNDPFFRSRQKSLIIRYNEMFSNTRQDAIHALEHYSSDNDNNQRIVFHTLMEAFKVAQSTFRVYKNRVRTELLHRGGHSGHATSDEAVQAAINRSPTSPEVHSLVAEVLWALSHNPRVRSPCCSPGFEVVRGFARDACAMAWEMTTLAHPLEAAWATEGEVLDEHRYRRSCDSEFSCPLVHHHIWPCLMQGARVIVKGEVSTKRTATMVTNKY